jgi:hypothetical protein
MTAIKVLSFLLSAILISGCATTSNVAGPKGPQLVASGRSTESGHYAEVGVQFSTTGDFVALFSPSRWKNPVETGGSLSWLNPVAWSDDAGRTSRVLLGEAAAVGVVAVAAIAGSSSGDGDHSASGSPTPPPDAPPTGGPGGGGAPPGS